MYDDKIVVGFLKFGWPVNCDTTTGYPTKIYFTELITVHQQLEQIIFIIYIMTCQLVRT